MLNLMKCMKAVKILGSVTIAVCALGILVLSTSAQQEEKAKTMAATVSPASHLSALPAAAISAPEISATVDPTGTTPIPIPNTNLPIMFESITTVGTATVPPAGMVVAPQAVRYMPLFEVQ